jgi:thymidylate kinase
MKRQLLSAPVVRRLWTMIMIVDYTLQIAPKLTRARLTTDVVIADRYRDDVLVDLCAGRDLVETPRMLRWLLPDPVVTLFFDLDEEDALARKPDSPDLAHLIERRTLYRELARRNRAVLIDAHPPVEAVSDAVLTEVQSRLSTTPGS